jgi:hypothetical protein
VSFDPDVLWFSSSGIHPVIIDAAQQAAIEQFLQIPGKRVVGTFLIFNSSTFSYQWLKPYFGVETSQQFQLYDIGDNVLLSQDPASPLLTGVGPSYVTGGWTETTAPADARFDPGDTFGSVLLHNSTQNTVMHYWQGPVNDAIYFSYMPEFGGNTMDRQLLYNAMAKPGHEPAVLSLEGTVTIGQSAGLSFSSPGTPNDLYAIALALGTTPGIPLVGGKRIPLNPDALFWLSLLPGTPNFVHMTGTLDASGNAPAWAVLLVPNDPALINATVFAAAVTFDSMSLSGIGCISQPVPITIQ